VISVCGPVFVETHAPLLLLVYVPVIAKGALITMAAEKVFAEGNSLDGVPLSQSGQRACHPKRKFASSLIAFGILPMFWLLNFLWDGT